MKRRPLAASAARTIFHDAKKVTGEHEHFARL
jgi:hypothetical protein